MLDAVNVSYHPHKISMKGVQKHTLAVGRSYVQRKKVIFPMLHGWQRAKLDLNAFIIVHCTKTLKPVRKSTDIGIMKEEK